MGQRIDNGLFLLKITVHSLAQGAVLFQRLKVQAQVFGGLFYPKPADQRIVQQPVLGCNFGGGVPGGAAADAVRFHQDAGNARLFQFIGAQQPSQPAADNQHIGSTVSRQRWKGRKRAGFLPNGLHRNHPQSSMRTKQKNIRENGGEVVPFLVHRHILEQAAAAARKGRMLWV